MVLKPYTPIHNPELESVLKQDPDNLDNWAEYSGWLQDHNDARGRVIALELVLLREKQDENEQEKISDEIRSLYINNLSSWVGKELLEVLDYESSSRSENLLVTPVYPKEIMRFGFLTHAKINLDKRNKPVNKNQIELILDENMANIQFLTNLDLSNNRLQKLPKSIENLHNLTYLNISDNNMKKLSGIIRSLKSLQFLDVSSNGLSELPEFIGELVDLKHLSLNDNWIQQIPDTLSHCESLESLALGHTGVRALPKWVSRFSQLTMLDLSRNGIEQFPEIILRLSNLIKLDLSFNQLKKIPRTICNLSKLQELNVRRNKAPYHSADIEIPESFRIRPGLKLIE